MSRAKFLLLYLSGLGLMLAGQLAHPFMLYGTTMLVAGMMVGYAIARGPR